MGKEQRCGGILFKEVRKMGKGLRRFVLGLVAVGMCLALLLSSAIPVCEAEPVEKVVKLGMRASLTGPLAGTTLWAHNGQFDYVKWLNEEQGGIDGIRVKWVWEDIGSRAPRAISAHRRIKESGAVIETESLVTAAELTTPAQQRDEIPLFYMAGFSTGMLTKPIRWTASAYPGFAAEAATFMKWVKENWAEERLPRIGMIIINDRAGYSTEEGSQFAGEVGVEYVGYEVAPVGCIDVSVELLRLAAKKPDWIYAGAYGATMVTIIKDAARLELQKKGINFAAEAASVDEIVLRVAGKAGEGWYSMRIHPTYLDTHIPGVMLVLEHAKKYRGLEPEEVAGHYLAGWAETQVMVEAVRQAIKKVGFENLTGRAVRDALLSLENVIIGIVPGTEIGFFPPVTMSEELPFMTAKFRICHVEDGKIMPYSDWFDIIHPEYGIE